MTNKFVVYNLRETYHELGEYEFKIVLSPKFFKNGHLSGLSFVDSDGKKVEHTLQCWGRKMNCKFVICDKVSDGVASVKLALTAENGKEFNELLTMWIIKP
jgi:hypothetical protein